MPLPYVRFDQRAGLRPRIVRERIFQLQQIVVARVLLAEEIQPALLHPVLPRRFADFVRGREDRVLGASTFTGAYSSVTRFELTSPGTGRTARR